MCGVFICGVLDYLMDYDICFFYIIGVFVGVCNGFLYMFCQCGWVKYSNIDLLEKYYYIGLKYLFKKWNILDFDFFFMEFFEYIFFYDYQVYFDLFE